MKFLLLTVSCCLWLTASAWGLSYYCRDSNGTEFFADSPEWLPESCQGEIWQLEQQDPPAASTSAPESTAPAEKEENLLERMIEEDVLAIKVEQLKAQTGAAVEKYDQGSSLLDVSPRRLRYGRRERTEKGKKLILEAQQAKQEILNELEVLQLAPKNRQEIENQLELIK